MNSIKLCNRLKPKALTNCVSINRDQIRALKTLKANAPVKASPQSLMANFSMD